MAGEIWEAVRQHLLGDTDITDLVNDRINPDELPQGEDLPSLVGYIIDSTSEQHLGGAAGVATTRLQIDAFADSRSEATYLQKLVRDSLITFHRGLMHDTFVNGVVIGSSLRNSRDAAVDGSDNHRYLCSRDYLISHEE